MASLRTRLELALVAAWQQRGPLAWVLAPISVLHYFGYRVRQALYRVGVLRQARIDVPVVVIGNLYVGGTGKTPLTVELARSLAERGWRPGIVSRGYRAAATMPRVVVPEHDAREAGDEPLLIARATGMPVAVARDRIAAARLLRAQHPECNVVISDDGLQHWPLARDMEIALLNYRGLGNGWLLPAGPLREPGARLDAVDAIVCNGDVPPIQAAAPRYSMQTALGAARPLKGVAAPVPLAELAAEQRSHGWRLTAAAGIGTPDRFFAMLRAAGLEIREMPLADHFDFVASPFSGLTADRILITEKDAVKCESNPVLANDVRIWVVPLRTAIDPRLVDAVVERLHRIPRRNARGPSTA
jgi:tetraacyldisaccharide 4'-kinase